MKRFAALYLELDSATSTQRKLAALVAYFAHVEASDAAWASYFLAGGKPRQTVNSRILRTAAARAAQMADWMFDECYDAVGDLGETIALILPPPQHTQDITLTQCLHERILPLRGLAPEAQIEALAANWLGFDAACRFLFNKLITGSFRVGVSRLMITRALAQIGGVDANRIAQRLVSYLASHSQPSAAAWQALMQPDDVEQRGAEPYPFFLAQSLQSDPAATLGDAQDWQVEWKWDGMRGQLVKRAGRCELWSRGDELVSEKFPELMEMAAALPDGCVLDGEILAWHGDAPRPFANLQTRMSRKRLSAKFLADTPVAFMAYDLLEARGADVRAQPMAQRRFALQELVRHCDHPRLRLSPLIAATTWEDLAQLRDTAREQGAEGFMLKRRDSAYGVGRTKGDARGEWWKWKLDPMSVDAVLIYAQRGHGRRASLYTDYTFAVWGNDAGERALVPFAKAYSGLTDAEIREVDSFIRSNTLEKFGPVRTVRPQLVMEIGFEGVQKSTRHKSGIAVRFPRILRIRNDKPMEEADSLSALHELLDMVEGRA